MELNDKQTPIEYFEKKLPAEAYQNIYNAIQDYEYIRRLIGVNRLKAVDMPKDEDGCIQVDISNLHILEDMDFFRQPVLKFLKTQRYTEAIPSTHKKSAWATFWKEEAIKCLTRVINPTTGEWIPGDYYFYLNYSPIMRILKDEKGEAIDRIFSFPDVYDGDYLYFHYLYQARHYTDEFVKGNHAAAMKCRGRGYSFKGGSQLGKRFILGESLAAQKKIRALVLASEKEYLIKDGILNKFVDIVTHCIDHTGWSKSILKNNWNTMEWRSGYMTKDGIERGRKNEVIGVSMKDNPGKARGKRPHPYYCNILTPDGFKKYGDICIGDIVYGDDGLPTKVIDIPFDGEDDIYKITLKDNRITYAAKDHLFEIIHFVGNGKHRKQVTEIMSVLDIINRKEKNTNVDVLAIRKNNCVTFKEQPLFIDSYVMGLFLGDGCYTKCSSSYINLTMSVADISDIEQYIPYKVIKSSGREISHKIELIEPKITTAYAKMVLTFYGLNNKKSSNKFIPKEYLYNSEINRLKLLRGLLDTDGTCTTQGTIEYCTKSEQLKNDVMFLCRSLGINTSCYLKYNHRLDNIYYRIRLHVKDKHLFNLKRKQNRVKTKRNAYGDSFSEKTSIVNIEYIGKQQCKCITVDNKSHLYLIDDFVITHNCNIMLYEEFGKFPNLLDVVRTNRPSTEAGPIAFGQMCFFGTGGEIGDAFQGAEELIYNPEGYRIHAIPNIYDKGLTGNTKCAFFSPEVLNLEGCYDKNGNSDVIKALAHIMLERFKVKYNTSKPEAITGHIAEHPISISESIMRKEGSIFPITDLKEYLDNCKSQGISFFNQHYIGELFADGAGLIKWRPVNDKIPLRQFKLSASDSKLGCVEIFEMPKRDSEGIMKKRYIAGIDPIDDDTGTSLASIFIFDTFNQCIVAEYTGRPKFADDFFEICRRLIVFYSGEACYENNKKGLFAYFSQRNCTYLLSGNPTILVDKEMMKGGQYGNKSVGVHATDDINAYARRLIRNWLIKPASDVFQEFDAEGNQITQKLNLHCIKSLPLLEELIAWDGNINTDRVSAMGMVMILNEEYKKINQVYETKVKEEDFFSSDYWDQYQSKPFSYGTTKKSDSGIFKYGN